jgi:hypothetical protein
MMVLLYLFLVIWSTLHLCHVDYGLATGHFLFRLGLVVIWIEIGIGWASVILEWLNIPSIEYGCGWFFLKSWPRGLFFFFWEKRGLISRQNRRRKKKYDDEDKNIFVYKNKYIFKMRDIKGIYLYSFKTWFESI